MIPSRFVVWGAGELIYAWAGRGTHPGRRRPHAFTERSLNHHVSPVGPPSLDFRYIPADHHSHPPDHVRSVSALEAQGSTCLDEVPSSSQCGSTPALQFKVILRREFHSIRTGCTHRTILVCAYHDLRHMPAAIRAVPQAQPHCQLARYNPSMPPCHPMMYTPPLCHPARSNPLGYITSAMRCIIEPCPIIPAMHGVDQGISSLRALQAVHEVLFCTGRRVHQ